MPKYLLSLILVFTLSFSCRAQFVTIPDANFVSWLNGHGFASCITGNQLDTTCPAVTSATSLNLNSSTFRSMDGIQYFSHLINLTCDYAHVDTIPALPPNLVNLELADDSFITLPALPQGLVRLNCEGNFLTSMPALPATLKNLNCGYSWFAALPALPNGIDSLNCDDCNGLLSVPTLPDSLKYFILTQGNHVALLPALPNGLKTFICNRTSIHYFPTLPDSLSYFDCSSNTFIDSFPTLPNALRYFNCSAALYYLLANPHLPLLPNGLVELHCDFNYLTYLPPLPDSLVYLYCSNDSLTSLPSLPNALALLNCSYNKLTSLPSLAHVASFQCQHNNLTWLPALPANLYYLDCSNNPNLHCLPLLKSMQHFYFSNTAITCVPNYANILMSTPDITTLPLCNLFDSTGCPFFWDISGHAYLDTNANCVYDSTSLQLSNIKVTLSKNGLTRQQILTRHDGIYTFQDSLGAYTVSVDTTGLPFTITCPANNLYNDTLTSLDSLIYNQDFFFKCKPGFDVGVRSIYAWFKPALKQVMKINVGDLSNFYGAHCADSVAGAVTVIMNGPAHYVSPATGAVTPSLVNGDTIRWDIANYGATNADSSFNFNFVTDSFAPIGQTVCVTVIATPITGDYNPGNNTLAQCFIVRNSFDPNEKEVYPTGIVAPNTWLTYTIRFQNTGTAPAVNVHVNDTLNNNLDPSTFQLLAASAPTVTQVKGNVIIFNFPNINLPDSLHNDTSSRGFVQFKIKVDSIVAPAAIISNKAAIYFDLNNPVVTNTAADTAIGCRPDTIFLTGGLCAGDSVYFYGHYIYSPGSYDTLLTGACDTLVYLTLAVQDPIPPTHLYDTICANNPAMFNGVNVDTTGTYTAHFSAVNGCDSTVSLHLVVNAVPVVTFTLDSLAAQGDFYYGWLNEWCGDGSPPTFILSGGNPRGGIYSGLGIYNNVFIGDSAHMYVTNLIYYRDTITYTYTANNGCSASADTSIILDWGCESITVVNPNTLFTLYPNPADDYVMIDFDGAYTGSTIFVKDITGRQLLQTQLTASPQQLPTGNLPPGVYVVTLYNNGQVAARLLVKE